jgi:hypothetical protein
VRDDYGGLGSSMAFFHAFKFCSENIERYRKIIQQRIVAVKEESHRKYGNLVESIPGRLKQIAENKGVSLALGGCDD